MSTLLRRGEYHAFDADGAKYLYLVPSAAVFRLDDTSRSVLDVLALGDAEPNALANGLSERFPLSDVRDAVEDLLNAHAIRVVDMPVAPASPAKPRKRIPLTTLVMNVTSKCNLSCTYCYEYGEDKLSEASTKPRFMDEATARKSVDFMFAESEDSPVVHLTFFGGETLMNFKVLKSSLAYARERAAELGKTVEPSLTTNATLLREEIIDWIVANDVGVTVSMDGDREQQDKFRVFNDGMGSYDIMIPNVKMLIDRHKSKPVGARVTLTKQNLDVLGIYKHLRDEVGFWEVGFAPVTTSWQRDYAIQDDGFREMLGAFQQLAHQWLEFTLAGKHHGFTNVRSTLQEIHKGMSKAYPCGAGLGLMGVATDGDVALCHRFAGSDSHKLGTVFDGIDRGHQDAFFDTHHIDAKTDCAKCWARPICAGGCYHEAHTRYGSTESPNLHYCDWIRSWTDTCLQVYGTLAERNPQLLHRDLA